MPQEPLMVLEPSVVPTRPVVAKEAIKKAGTTYKTMGKIEPSVVPRAVSTTPISVVWKEPAIKGLVDATDDLMEKVSTTPPQKSVSTTPSSSKVSTTGKETMITLPLTCSPE